MYKITILMKNEIGSDLIVEADSHQLLENGLFSIIGVDKKRYLIPLSSIAYIEFDERLDEILAKTKAEK